MKLLLDLAILDKKDFSSYLGYTDKYLNSFAM